MRARHHDAKTDGHAQSFCKKFVYLRRVTNRRTNEKVCDKGSDAVDGLSAVDGRCRVRGAHVPMRTSASPRCRRMPRSRVLLRSSARIARLRLRPAPRRNGRALRCPMLQPRPFDRLRTLHRRLRTIRRHAHNRSALPTFRCGCRFGRHGGCRADGARKIVSRAEVSARAKVPHGMPAVACSSRMCLKM